MLCGRRPGETGLPPLPERHDQAVVPGSGFGLAPCFRLSYASPEQNFGEAAKRIAKALREPS